MRRATGNACSKAKMTQRKKSDLDLDVLGSKPTQRHLSGRCTWLHRRENSSCQPGAVHTWHFPDLLDVRPMSTIEG
jgi:hypothetical protein